MALDIKPEIKIQLAGEELDLDFVIGCIRVAGENDEDSRTLICGHLDENDILNALRFMTRDVVSLLRRFLPEAELFDLVNQCVTDGMNEGLDRPVGSPDSFN